MKKHLQILSLVAALCLPWVGWSQTTLEDYVFSTGVDASKWITLPTTLPSLITPGAGDYGVSSVQNLGFTFPFGPNDYTQFSVNADGNLKLGSSVTGTSYYSSPFTSSNASYNNPKINMFGCDGYCASNHYVRYLDTVDANGAAVGVVEFCTGTYTSSTRSNEYKWQVHLYHSGTIEIVFGTAPAAGPAVSQQRGLCMSASDGWLINASHAATHFTNGSSSTISSGTWPAEGRYYAFALDNDCPRPVSIAAENISPYDATIVWSDPLHSSWMVYYHPTDTPTDEDSILVSDTSYNLSGLSQHTSYSVSVVSQCDTMVSIPRNIQFMTPWACPPVEDLAVTYLTVDSAILNWREVGTATSWVVEYDTADFVPGTGMAMSVTAYDTTVVIDGLDTGATYYVYVHADCGGDTSINMSVSFTTLAALPATVPYTCNFEGEGTNGWDLYNGGQTNKWYVGSAVNNGGGQSLYISNNGGMANNYGNGSISYTYAKRTISLAEDGEYAYSFDWRCQGENEYYDYVRAFLIPTAEDYLADGSCPGGSTYSFSTWMAPATWHDLSGRTSSTYTLNQSSSWQTRVGTLQLTAGTYNLVFAWANDGSGGSNPAAAVDNVSFIRNSCPQVQNLAAAYVGNDTVILEWGAGSEESEWIVSDGTDEITVSDSTYLFEGLMPATAYTFSVRSICSSDDTSLVSTITVRTPCGEFGPLPFADDFNTYASSSYPDCWTRVMSGSYPYVTSSYGNSIMFAGTAAVISPRMPAPLNNLFVTFDLQKEGSSSGSMEFGYTRDPNSVSDMVVLYTINPTTTGTYFTYEYDLSADTCTDSVYLVWRQNSSATNWYYWLDNVSVTRASSCSPVTNLRCSSHNNVEATIAWNDTASDSHSGIWVYIATTNNMAAAFDSMYVSGANNHTFTGLRGNTHYYVWAVAECPDENSREIACEFTTDVDCAPVRNLAATSQMHSISLTWNAPTAGEPATMYHVAWKKASESAWNTDSTTNTYYYIGGLDMNTNYQYRVTTSCDGSLSAQNAGTIATVLCGAELVGTNDGTNSYVPTYIYYGYSYTQQIHQASELMNVGDTIVGLAFNAGSASPDGPTTRPVDIYLGNTSQNNFSSTSNYISADSLQLVYTGNLSVNEGWNMVTFTTPFVRDGRNIVVAVDDNTGSYVSSNGWVSTATPDSRSLYFYQDGTNITPSSPSADSYGLVNGVNQLTFYTTDCNDNGCERPNVVVSDANMDEISIAWYPEVSGASYTITYAPVGSSVVTTAATGVTAHNYTLTGLSTGIDYIITVSFDCQGDTLSGSVVASTQCGAVTLPYTEDFQSVDYGEFSRSCWTTGTSYADPSSASYPYPYVVSLTGDENNKLCLLYEGSYLILPRMDAPLSDLQIRFTLLQGGDNVPLLFGLINDPSDTIASMNILETFVRSNYTSESSINITYPFDNVTDTAGYIAFWSRDGVNYSFLDNIVVEYIPNCTAPTAVTATNVTTNSADINWTGNATSYVVEYGLRGFVPGTGTVEYASSNTVTLTGLASSSNYEAYVYAICGTDTSVASNVVRFTTECDVVTLPYIMNFDNVAEAGVTRAPLPNCWSYAMLDASYSGDSYIPATYYTTSAGYTTSGSYCLWLYGTTVTALPEMPTTVDSLMITFHDYNTYTSDYKLIIGAVDSVTPGFEASFVGIDTINFTGSSTNVLSFLSDYTGTGRYIAFKTYNTNGYGYSYHYIDDIVVDRIPSCVYPVNLRTTSVTGVSADITWSVCQANDYEFEYGPTGFARGTGIFDTCSGRVASITGLSYGTTYDIYVRGICDAGDTSAWSSCFTFSTLNSDPVSSYPYICPFSDTTLTNCGWEVINGTQTNKWYVGTAAHYGTADNMGLYISDNNGTSNTYTNSSIQITYAYRAFSMNAGSYNIGFNWQAYGESNYDYLRAWLVPGIPNVTAGQLPDGSNSTYNYTSASPAGWISLDGGDKLNLQTSWQTQNADVTVPANGTYSIVFMWANDVSGGSNPPAGIDNVEVFLNTCPAPDNIYTTSVGTTSMVVDWVDINPTVSWQIEYGQSGFTRGMGTMMNVTSHPVSIAGLDSLTSYDFYIRPICSDSDTGRWSDRATFGTTICDNASVATNATACTQSTQYFPGYSLYNYSYSEVIIDSADLAGSTDITAFQFKPQDVAAGSSYMNNCTIYLAHTNLTNLSRGFIQDTATFVPVFTGSLNFSTNDWQTVAFDSAFTWDGHSNIVVAVNRQNGSYASSGYFDAFSASASKARYIYQDGSAYTLGSISGGTSTIQVPIYRLISCGAAGCATPTITGTAHTYESATV
ncbi:MAG: fibronectin type III domain-containing protein, partial [Prevotella sp.]|nr:fibronectin type III domain-containing protein [Prevotella sp.]